MPLVPLTVFVDGLRSRLRTYSPAELRKLVASFKSYTWETGTLRGHSSFAVTYLLGYPKQSA